MIREPSGDAALVAFKNGNHLAYAGIYYYNTKSMPGSKEGSRTGVVELYAREKFGGHALNCAFVVKNRKGVQYVLCN